MAVFHMDIKAHSRSLNVHAIALSSYRSGERLHCDADGRIRNCRSGIKSAVEFTALVNNRDLNRERLWNKVEAMEKRKDAVVAREMELGLPCELNIEQQKALALSIAEKIAERYNCAVDLALHAPDSEGDQRNWHVHLLFSPRSWTGKDKRNEEFSTKKYRDLNKANAKQEVLYWRQLWEEKVNQALEKAGQEERVSSLSCEARGEIKKYEHFDFNKYQLLRRSGELEDAKRASRLALEISRDELELEDLIEIKNELIKEKESLLQQLEEIKEKENAQLGRTTGETGRRQSHFTETESRHIKTTGENGIGTGSTESSERGEGMFTDTSRNNDQSFGGMATATESAGNPAVGAAGRTAWGSLKATAQKLWQFIFKNDLLTRLNPFKKPLTQKDYKQNQPLFSGLKRTPTQLIMEPMYGARVNRFKYNRAYKNFMKNVTDQSKQEIYKSHVKNIVEKSNRREDHTLELCLVKLLDLEAEKAAIQRKLEVEDAIQKTEDKFKAKFIRFRGCSVKSDYKTIIIARHEEKSFFGKLKSSRDVIIDFHKQYKVKPLQTAASMSSIEEVKSLADSNRIISDGEVSYLQKEFKYKSGWRVYEIKVKEKESLEDVLKKNCANFEIDPNLIKREAKINEEWRTSTENIIANLKENGITKISLSSYRSEQVENQEEQSRGIRF